MIFLGSPIYRITQISTTSTENSVPIYIEHIPSRRANGRLGSYILKDGPLYYKTAVKSLNPTSINLACHKRLTRKCTFRVNLKIVKIFNPDLVGFYDPSNFIVKSSKGLESHSCEGYRTIYEARL